MIRLTVVCLLSFILKTGFCQDNIKNIILSNAIPLSDAANDPFEKIGAAIGNAQIVMLGEQDHGDGATFPIKAALIKYLHEKKGFDVLAFETDIFSMNYAWEEVQQHKISVDSAIQTSLFAVWTNCKECNGTFDYIKQCQVSKVPLSLTGFDNQLVFKSVLKKLKPELFQYLNTTKTNFTTTEYFAASFPSDMDSLLKIFRFTKNNPKEKIEMLEKMKGVFMGINNQLLQANRQSDYAFILIENCISYCQELISIYKDRKGESTIRDRQMAKNLAWLINNKFKNKKIIVWAANSHVIKGYLTAFTSKFMKAPSMGSYFLKDSFLKERTYVLGFTGYSGSFGRATTGKEYRISKSKSNSLEAWLHNAKWMDCFIDFGPIKSSSEVFNMNCFNWLHYKADWQNYFDGIIYVDNMIPCTQNILMR
jgi:erythromycin esterase